MKRLNSFIVVILFISCISAPKNISPKDKIYYGDPHAFFNSETFKIIDRNYKDRNWIATLIQRPIPINKFAVYFDKEWPTVRGPITFRYMFYSTDYNHEELTCRISLVHDSKEDDASMKAYKGLYLFLERKFTANIDSDPSIVKIFVDELINSNATLIDDPTVEICREIK